VPPVEPPPDELELDEVDEEVELDVLVDPLDPNDEDPPVAPELVEPPDAEEPDEALDPEEPEDPEPPDDPGCGLSG